MGIEFMLKDRSQVVQAGGRRERKSIHEPFLAQLPHGAIP
jgi:hypothetical protein